jgi:hypothetical protein
MVTAVDDRVLNEVGRAVDRNIHAKEARMVYLNFLDAVLGLDRSKYRASEFPNGFFDQVIDRISEQPAMVLAIQAWDEEANLVEENPAADGILGTAATEALRMAKALSAARFGKDSE